MKGCIPGETLRTYLTLLLLLLLAGCASHPTPTESYSVAPDASPLGRRIQQLATEHAYGHSGFRLLPESTEAFAARTEMIRAAQVSLDIQYYIVHDGLTTRALIDEVLQAADRGVRVRLLLDDTTSHGEDYRIGTLAAHPTTFRSASSTRFTSAAATPSPDPWDAYCTFRCSIGACTTS